MAKEITQEHVLKDGTRLQIKQTTRKYGYNEAHKYTVAYPGKAFGPEMSSVTSVNHHSEGDTFGVGVGYAVKQIRQSKPLNFNAAQENTDRRIAEGNALHKCIENYINSKGQEIDEENDMFTAWLKDVGSKYTWVASEVLLYHPTLGYGGTADAISVDAETVIWDWKTKSRESYDKYGPEIYHKDHAQLAAYADALSSMGSIFTPTKANIAYIMDDGSYAEVVPVDLELSTEIFGLSYKMTGLVAVQKTSIKGRE